MNKKFLALILGLATSANIALAARPLANAIPTRHVSGQKVIASAIPTRHTSGQKVIASAIPTRHVSGQKAIASAIPTRHTSKVTKKNVSFAMQGTLNQK